MQVQEGHTASKHLWLHDWHPKYGISLATDSQAWMTSFTHHLQHILIPRPSTPFPSDLALGDLCPHSHPYPTSTHRHHPGPDGLSPSTLQSAAAAAVVPAASVAPCCAAAAPGRRAPVRRCAATRRGHAAGPRCAAVAGWATAPAARPWGTTCSAHVCVTMSCVYIYTYIYI